MWAASGVLTAAGRSLAAQPGVPAGLWTSTAHHPDRPRALLLVTRRRSAMKAAEEEEVPPRSAAKRRQCKAVSAPPPAQTGGRPRAVHRLYGCKITPREGVEIS